MNRNTTKIFSFISEKAKEYNIEYENEKNKLRRHQFIVNKFFTNIQFDHIKGMLFYHSMGSGKTITSISIALEFIKNFKEKVIIMANKSLHQNYLFDIKKYLTLNNMSEKDINTLIENNFIFLSMNASNIVAKFKSINIKKKLLIVDEAHNMFNAVVNGSQNMTEIYNIIRNETNLKLILLSGTPIVNTPYESVICFNLLINKKYNILPENYADFLNYFIDIDNDDLYKLRLDKLGNRIVGLISHYENEVNEDFPKNLGIEIIKCPMTKTQTEQYFIFKNMELEKQSNYFSKNRGKNIGIAKNAKGSIGDYKIKTRMLSNILPQDDVLNCIKFNKIYENINNINNGSNISLIYSQFTNDFGIASLEKYLIKKDMLCLNKEFNISQLNETDFFNNLNNDSTTVEKILKKKYFAIISGAVEFEDRQKIQNLINNPKNKYGKYISIVMVSSTGAEGLNFSNLRSIHILESYWNYSRILQIQARGIRYLSHKELKPDEQNVKTFIYLSHLTDDVKTTDEEIYELAINNYDLINDFLHLYKRYSIDCDFHFKEDCAKCNVETKPLFNDNFEIDINISNPCHANIHTEIEVKHVENNVYKDNKGKLYKLVNDELIPL
jgi:hypothetical protein